MTRRTGKGWVPRAEVLRDEILGEDVERFLLPCGLPVLVHHKPGYRKKVVCLGVNYGSVDNAFVDRSSGEALRMPAGIAHFLEHKLFERRGGDAFETFSRQGASANAMTSFRSTQFFFTCSANETRSLRTLLGLAKRPEFSEAAIEKEKGIVTQEIRMYEDSPDWRGYMNLVRGLFVRHPVRTDVTGSVESIRRIDRDALMVCHRNFYDPANLCLAVSGDVDGGEIAAVAASVMGEEPGRGAARRLPVREPKRVVATRTEARFPVERPSLAIGFKDPRVPVRGADLQKRDLVTGVLLDLMFGSSSRTWQRLYEEDVIDDSFYTSYAGEEDFGFVSLGCETDDPEGTRGRLFREIRRFGREGFSNDDFGRIVHKWLGRFVRGLDSQEGTVFLWVQAIFRGVNPLRVATQLRLMTPDEVMARHADLFGSRNHSTSLVRA